MNMENNNSDTTTPEPEPDPKDIRRKIDDAFYDQFDQILANFASLMDDRHLSHYNVDAAYVSNWRHHPEALEDELAERLCQIKRTIDADRNPESACALAALCLMKIADAWSYRESIKPDPADDQP